MKISERLAFYARHSLVYYFYTRLVHRFRSRHSCYPDETECHGIKLNLSGLPPLLKQYMIDGRYENAEITLLQKHFSGTEKILEIGSAVGLVGLYCKTKLGVQHLASVEPNPHTSARLRENYALNNQEPNLIEAALTDTDGRVSLHVTEMFWSDSILPRFDPGHARVIDVPCYTLGRLIDLCGFDVDALIIDVEGAEQYIRGSDIPSTVSAILIELHPHLIGPANAFGFLNQAINAGFLIEDQIGDVWFLRRGA